MEVTKQFFSFLLSGIFISNAYALPFNIVPNGPLPSSITSGNTVSANYMITNATNRYLSRNLVKWLPPHVAINPAFTTCLPSASNFNLNSGQSCNLALTISGQINRNDPDPHHHLFVCASDRATCAGPIPANSLNVNTPRVNTFAYVANNGNSSVSLCPINNGVIQSCTYMFDSTFFDPAGLALNPSAPFLYVSNNGNSIEVPFIISLCPVQSNGTIAACTALEDSTFDSPEGMTFNAQGTLAYIVNMSNNTVSLCPVNSNGTFQACSAMTGGFSSPLSIVLNASGNMAYVVNSGNDTVSLCLIQSNGMFGTCSALNDATFVMPEGIALNPAGTFAYVTNNNNLVSQCPINAGTGTFGACTSLSGNFSSPEGITLNSAGSIAYITNTGNSSVSACPINSDGTFATCKETSNNLDAPVGIVLN